MFLMTSGAIWILKFAIHLSFILQSDLKILLSSFSLTSLAVCVISLEKLEGIENNPNYKNNTLITRFCFEVLINLILMIHVLRSSGSFCSIALQYVFLNTDWFIYYWFILLLIYLQFKGLREWVHGWFLC